MPDRLRSRRHHPGLWVRCVHDQRPCCTVDCTRDFGHGTASHQSVGCVFIRYGNLRGANRDVIRTGVYVAHRHKVFSGMVPFHDMTPAAAAVGVSLGKRPERPSHPSFTDNLWDLTEHCWSQKPQHRPEISRVIPRLRATSLRRGHMGGKETQAAENATVSNSPRWKGFWFSRYEACRAATRSSPAKRGRYGECPG